MKRNKLRFLGISLLLATFFFTTQSCKQATKFAAKKIMKKIAKKTVRVAGTAALLLTVEEVMAHDLLKEFERTPINQQPINISIYNQNSNYVSVLVTKDGNYWEEQSIKPNHYLNYESTRKGLVGVKSGKKMFLLRESENFELKREGGSYVIQQL